MIPWIQLSQENKDKLEALQIEDIEALIQHYSLLYTLEITLLITLSLALLGLLLYSLGYSNLFKKKSLSKTEQLHFLETLQQEQSPLPQSQWLDHYEKTVRFLLKEHFNLQTHPPTDKMTYMELTTLFQTPTLKNLEPQGKIALSLLSKGKYGNIPLNPSEKKALTSFLTILIDHSKI